MKHQLDATLCRFYFCRATLHVSGIKQPSSGVFKTSTAATGTCVIVAGQLSAYLIVPDGCIRSVQFSFNVLVVVYLSYMFGIAKF